MQHPVPSDKRVCIIGARQMPRSASDTVLGPGPRARKKARSTDATGPRPQTVKDKALFGLLSNLEHALLPHLVAVCTRIKPTAIGST